MPESSRIRTQWLIMTSSGPRPASVNQRGNVDPTMLKDNAMMIAAWQNHTLVAMASVAAETQKIRIHIPEAAVALSKHCRKITDDPWKFIVREVRDSADQIKLHNLAVLLPDENIPGTERLRKSLTRSNLQHKARIGVWQLTPASLTPPAPAAGYSIRRVPARSLSSLPPGDRQSCLDMLTPILANSSDLTQIPSPEPNSLLTEWGEMDGTLFIESDPTGRDIALCACVVCDSKTLPAGTLATEINYLGVLPEFRRQGAAHRLIAAAARLAANPHATSATSNPALITACADEDNIPAVQLYTKAGFSRQQALQLWLDS